ncbi:type II secretion system F family protein [Patescibacteria group bacterium]|nr:type II secretion system F family protein [Patescibacteria group bacterium]
MVTYFYKAIKESGEIYKDTIDAENDSDLTKKVRDQGGALISFDVKNKLGFSFFKKLSLIGTVSTQDKIIFAKNLGAMIGAGLSVSRSLTTLEKQFKNPKFKNIIKNVNSDIKKGKTIHESLSEYPGVFSSLFVSMVKAGEESGKISDSLATVSQQMENSSVLKKKVKGAMIYPSLVMVVMFVIGILMLMFIVPALQESFADMDTALPFSTQVVISFSDFLINNTVLFLILVFFAVIFFTVSLRTEKGQVVLDTVILKIPVISTIVKEVNSARTARTLSSLLSSGVDVVSAFGITEDVLQNSYYKKVLKDARNNIQKGVPVADIFIKNENLYPPIVSAMIEVGEETGKLPEMLLSVADFYEGEVAQKTKNMSTIVEPIMMVIIGAAVGFFAVSMIAPMYSLMSGI